MADTNSDVPCYSSSFDNLVDEKRRVQIPSNWRRGQGETEFMLILWPSETQDDACLMVLPPDPAQRLRDRITSMGFGDSRAEALRRFIGRKSHMVAADKSGRITLPEHMALALGLDKKALLVGMLDRFQIWNPDRFEGVKPNDDALGREAFKMI